MTKALRIVALSEADSALWLHLAKDVGDDRTTEAQMRRLLKGDGAGAHLRLVALDDDRVIAKLAADLTPGGRLDVWPMAVTDGLDETAYGAVAKALLTACFEWIPPGEPVRYVETRPAETLGRFTSWLQALQGAGFAEIAKGHLYGLMMPGNLVSLERMAELRFRPINQVPKDLVEAIYARACQEGRDRADQTAPEAIADRLASRKKLRFFDFNPKHWVFGFLDERPVGFIFCSLEKPKAGEPVRALVVDTGVVPEARGQGLGRLMVRQGLLIAQSLGAAQTVARIDDENVAAIKLVRQAGFQRVPGAHLVLRRILSGFKEGL